MGVWVMLTVYLMPALRPFADGQPQLEIEALTVQGLFQALTARFPDLAPHLEAGIAVAVDGIILQDQLFAPLRPGADVHIMPMLAGG